MRRNKFRNRFGKSAKVKFGFEKISRIAKPVVKLRWEWGLGEERERNKTHKYQYQEQKHGHGGRFYRY